MGKDTAVQLAIAQPVSKSRVMPVALTLTLITVLFLLMTDLQAAIKCWKNNDGIHECGNTIPPEYSQQKHELLNNHGVTIDQTKRAKTEAELDEEERLTKIGKMQQELVLKQKEADDLLLKSYASSDDIILAREGKISAIKAEISLRQAHIKKLHSNLTDIIYSAANMERRGEKPTPKIIDNINSVKKQIKNNKRFILTKKQEIIDVKNKYNENLGRYRKLHHEKTSPVPILSRN